LEIEMLAITFLEARCDESRQQQEKPAAREIMSTSCRRGKEGRLLRSTLEMRGNLDVQRRISAVSEIFPAPRIEK